MARYIDAGVLIGKLVAEKHFYPAIVARAIDDTPTADVVSAKAYEQVKWERDTAIEQLQSYGVGFCENKELVEVVRCQECKYKKVGHNPLGEYYYCDNDKGGLSNIYNGTDFCSYGERREDNG